MSTTELYSQRRRRELGSIEDVFQYNVLSPKFRRQILFIVSDLAGSPATFFSSFIYRSVVESLRRETGVKRLVSNPYLEYQDEFEEYVEKGSHADALDAIELCLRLIHSVSVDEEAYEPLRVKCKEAINDFNSRCKQNSLGFSYLDGSLVRVDSQFLHTEAVIPALVVLRDPEFRSADEEFRSANDHWREGRFPETLVDCLKSFESTIKIIAAARGWTLSAQPTASQLVESVFANSLIPEFYKTKFAGLRSVLENGIPTPRNRAGGHGGGTSPTPVPPELVRFVLHLTAATILFLIDAHKGKP